MPFTIDDEDEELDLEEQFKDIKPPDKNMYIADSQRAVELLAALIRNEPPRQKREVSRIRKEINKMFGLFSDVHLSNELELYQEFMLLCTKLSKLQKVRKIKDKVVIGFGGRFSAGKSRFINSISGIDVPLPVDQEPMTSIPTYIMGAKENNLQANSVYGYSVPLTKETMGALTHEFNRQYHIGFAPFIDSIIAESKTFSLPSKICLLDTPGYSADKADRDTRTAFSDRQKAQEQLSISDYMIWLADIDNNAGLPDEDLAFIESLPLKTPILVVLNKSDLKPHEDIDRIIEENKRALLQREIKFFGVTAYSSNPVSKDSDEIIGEHGGQNLIQQFILNAAVGSVCNNDVLGEFRRLTQDMLRSIRQEIERTKEVEDTLFQYIKKSDKIMQIQSLTEIWGRMNEKQYQMVKLSNKFEDAATAIYCKIDSYIRE